MDFVCSRGSSIKYLQTTGPFYFINDKVEQLLFLLYPWDGNFFCILGREIYLFKIEGPV